VIVRPRGGRLPRTGRFIAPLIKEAEARQSIIVPQFDMLSWERLEAGRNFFRNWSDQPGFVEWQKDLRPLTSTAWFSDVVQFPYVSVSRDGEDGEEEQSQAPIVQAKTRRTPSQPAVMLGGHEDGGQVHWAPFETEAKLLNFGILVTGDPGSGKTQTLNVLIDGVAGMGFPVCIFDFKNDYSERSFVQAIGLKVHDVRRHGIPFNPLMPSPSDDGQAQPIEHIFTITGVVLARRPADGDAPGRHEGSFRAPRIRAAEVVCRRQHQAAEFRRCDHDPRRAEGSEKSAGDKPFGSHSAAFRAWAFPQIRRSARTVRGYARRKARLVAFRPADRRDQSGSRGTHHHPVARRSASPQSAAKTDPASRAGRSLARGTQYPGDLPPDLSGALDTKIYLKNQQPDHKKAVVRALCGANSGPEAANLHGILERLTQFEGIIQNQQYLPYARFKLVPYFARVEQTKAA
jgi:hypothetical protein